MPDLYLGGVIDPSSGNRTDELLEYEASDLTTHGVIVGMTGSGKTGLGVIFLEEALRSGIPTLVLDPKGDMTNLLLTFPDLAPSDFRPWIDEAAAKREGKSPDDLAEDTADLWKRGLASWDLDGGDIADLRDKAGFAIYTPGSSAGVPLNVIGSLQAPDLDWEADGETIRDEIEGFVSGLLGLVGIDADPLSSREHILLANIIEHAWRNGEDLGLEALLGRVHKPPIRKLGVFEVDTFFPEKDRMALAMKLNALAASPAFEEWRAGPALDPGALLWDEDGRPQAAILYLAHLSDDERQFVVTMALSRLITWMRSQPGSSDLRALVYMDEVFGFVPPTASPPAKKPILTLMKQARAFGVGMLLSTQNPVDLDYKAMSNAGTWAVGRLQTERDKLRILEALESARGDSDLDTLDRLISGLDKRQFLLHSTRSDEPVAFTTRWAMSYLRGPLTRDQVAELVGTDDRRKIRPAEPEAAPQPAAGDDATTVVAPAVADGIAVAHLDPAAPWAGQVAAEVGGTHHTAALAVRVSLTFDDRNAEVDHTEQWEAVYHPLDGDLDPTEAIAVDHDERDFSGEPPAGATYSLPEAPIGTKSWFSDAERAIEEHLYRTRKVEILRNAELKLYSRIGETAEEFAARCEAAAEEEADKEIATIRDRFEGKAEDIRERIEEANRKVDAAALDVDTRRQEEMASGAGTLIGVLLGRKSTSSMSTAASKRSMTRKAEQRLETARAKVTDEIEDLGQLEEDLLEEVGEIRSEWADKAAGVETLEIGLEKSDISLDQMTLVWVPDKP
jgi:hypothetical protein